MKIEIEPLRQRMQRLLSMVAAGMVLLGIAPPTDYDSLTAAGWWWGFVGSLLAAAVFLLWRVRVSFRRELRRVERWR